jgi:hypothetical protein
MSAEEVRLIDIKPLALQALFLKKSDFSTWFAPHGLQTA